ncbi:MAG: hypothetical protein EAZ62_00480 [Sphingobacteriia bacterium]|nr:MAG: hypothetical protein EAZ62_00480 [Sphingobacteriia bacterium]
MAVFSLFFYGWLLSFLGQLPLGNMSVTATQIAVRENMRQAWLYALGVTWVEMVYLRLALMGTDWVLQNSWWFQVLGWGTVVLFLVLGILALRSKPQPDGQAKAPVFLNNSTHRFWLGSIMSCLNPLQLPFWILWTTVFLQHQVLPSNAAAFWVFTLGAGAGTISGLALYMYAGRFWVSRLQNGQQKLNLVMGLVFVLSACIQAWRMAQTDSF